MLTKNQFEVLYALKEQATSLSQRKVAKETTLSLGTVNKTLKELEAKQYIQDTTLTEAGEEALLPYKVKRAIFIAAGFGSRLAPITLNTPKPLVRVKGTRLIDTMLDALLAQGIDEIYIVRGYLGEQFDQLFHKYPTIQFIDNPLYNESNNISSAMLVRHLYENAYVLDGDLLVQNPDVIKPYHYTSNYLAFPVEKTDEWCFQEKNGRIVGVDVGGTNGHEMIGVSYWTKEDGKRFATDIEKLFASPGGKEKFWDQVVLDDKLDDYELRIQECGPTDVIEIDTLNELKAIDPVYAL